jgi:hypothetical protein
MLLLGHHCSVCLAPKLPCVAFLAVTVCPSAAIPCRRYEKHIAEEELEKLSEEQAKAAKQKALLESVAAATGAAPAAAADGAS